MPYYYPRVYIKYFSFSFSLFFTIFGIKIERWWLQFFSRQAARMTSFFLYVTDSNVHSIDFCVCSFFNTPLPSARRKKSNKMKKTKKKNNTRPDDFL